VGIVIQDPIHFKQQFIDFRRRGIIPNTISICIQMNDKYIFIYSDEGRLIRPLIYYEDNQVVIYDKEPIKWSNLVKTKIKYTK